MCEREKKILDLSVEIKSFFFTLIRWWWGLSDEGLVYDNNILVTTLYYYLVRIVSADNIITTRSTE